MGFLDKKKRKEFQIRIPLSDIPHLFSESFTKRFYFICLFVFVIAHLFLVAYPISQRIEPIEVDDAYSYIAKSYVQKNCFDLECPALQNITEQINGQTDDYGQALLRNRIDLNLLTYYHPVYSVFFSILSTLGLNVIQIYNFLTLSLGSILLIALALWLRSLWGELIGGSALLLLTLYIFFGPGIHNFVPNNMALGFALLAWLILIKSREKLYWLIPFLWIISIGLHHVGLIYVGASLLFLLTKSIWPLEKSIKWLWISAIAIVGGRVLISFLIPQFSLLRDEARFFTDLPAYSEIVQRNLIEAKNYIALWANSYWSISSTLFFLLLGFWGIPKTKRKKIAINGFIALFIFLISLAFPNATLGSPAVRIWILLAFFLTGAIANGMLILLGFIWNGWKDLYKLIPILQNRDKRSNLRPEILFLSLIAFLLLGINMYDYSRYSLQHYLWTIENSIQRLDYVMGSNNLYSLLSDIQNKSTVVVTNESALYYGLINGLMDNGIVLYPAISNSEKEISWIQNNNSVEFALGKNPIVGLPTYSRGQIALREGARFIIRSSDSRGFSTPILLSESEFAMLTLLVEGLAIDGNVFQESYSLEYGLNNIPLLENDIAWKEIILYLENGSNELSISGFQANGIETNWPWNQEISIIYSESELAPMFELSLDFPSAFNGFSFDGEMLSDESSLIFAKVDSISE